MRTQRIRVSDLRGVSILFERDIYELALWLVRLDQSQTTPTSLPRHTVKGLVGPYSYMTRMNPAVVEARLVQAGLPLGASIEADDDEAAWRLWGGPPESARDSGEH